MTPWIGRSEFRGRYQAPDQPFPWWLVILGVLMIVAIGLVGIFWSARVDGYGEPIVLEVWATSYNAQEGFTNCRLLIAQGVNPAIAHSLHTNTANGTEPDWGTMAVDETVIPFGSIAYDKPYADLCGRYLVALDTGGSIKGGRVDLWVETTAQSFQLTGWHTIKILRWGYDAWLVDKEAWGFPKEKRVSP